MSFSVLVGKMTVVDKAIQVTAAKKPELSHSR